MFKVNKKLLSLTFLLYTFLKIWAKKLKLSVFKIDFYRIIHCSIMFLIIKKRIYLWQDKC